MWEILTQPFVDFDFMQRALVGCVAISMSCWQNALMVRI